MLNFKEIPQIKELKEFLLTDNNEIQTKKIVYKWIKNACPELISYFDNNFNKDDFREFIYCILNNITEFPTCPICGNKLPLRNFKQGFQKTCSKECQAKYYSQNTEVHQKVKETKSKQQTRQAKWLYNYNFSSEPNYTIFHNYCKHGDIKVYNKILYKMHDINEGSFCLQCNEEIYNNYKPTDNEIENIIYIFPEFFNKYNYALSWEFWMRYYPKTLKILVCYFNKYIHTFTGKNDLAELYYTILHKMKSLPKCPICEKLITKFHTTYKGYDLHCPDHLYGRQTSSGENELIDFIKSLNFNVVPQRKILNGKDIDCYIPEKCIGFEYNGCYFHSTLHKESNYHSIKKRIAKKKNIDLYFIWEDDWYNKQDIVKSLIKSKLGLFEQRIYARQCILKIVNINDAKMFLNNNHLQGYNDNGTILLGLYYQNELVSIMTFGKSRFKKDEMEIIRFANKLNYQVIGGASKLFSYFKKHYLNNNICVSYAHNDISNGNVYKILGFKEYSNRPSYTIFYNGLRYNYMSNITNKNSLPRCYSSGVTKYILKV